MHKSVCVCVTRHSSLFVLLCLCFCAHGCERLFKFHSTLAFSCSTLSSNNC